MIQGLSLRERETDRQMTDRQSVCVCEIERERLERERVRERILLHNILYFVTEPVCFKFLNNNNNNHISCTVYSHLYSGQSLHLTDST